MPRYEFTTGQVLTADQMNDLSDQTVMVFAGTAARGSAIPSPSEGMVTYLQDADELQVYTTAWGAVGGGLVATKTAVKTDTQTGSVASLGTLAITDLNISHAVSNAANFVILYAVVNGTQGSAEYNFNAGLTAGGSLINIGDAASTRSRVAASNGNRSGASAGTYMNSLVLLGRYAPGTTASVTYGVSVINADSGTKTLYVNRSETDTDNNFHVRGASVLILQEVAV